jgi:hypothetical protein
MAPAPNRSKRPATSLYPAIPYYILKLLQSLSAIAVAGVMFHFIGHMNQGHYALPWMFYFVSSDYLAIDLDLMLRR